MSSSAKVGQSSLCSVSSKGDLQESTSCSVSTRTMLRSHSLSYTNTEIRLLKLCESSGQDEITFPFGSVERATCGRFWEAWLCQHSVAFLEIKHAAMKIIKMYLFSTFKCVNCFHLTIPSDPRDRIPNTF